MLENKAAKIGVPVAVGSSFKGHSRRPEIDATATMGRAGNDALESEIQTLRSENALLRSEVANLRERLRRFEGHHECEAPTLTTQTPTPTFDLSRLDASLVTQIVSFVGTSLELINVALTCKSFGWQQPASGLDWSIAEEAARQAVCSGQHDIMGVRISVTQYVRGRMTWLSILFELEHPLKFDSLFGRDIEHGGRKAIRGSQNGVGIMAGTAVANNYVMESGIHFAEFQITAGRPFIGVVRPMSNLDPVRFADGSFHFFGERWYDDFLAARTDEWGDGNVHACEYYCGTGIMNCTNWGGEQGLYVDWRGWGAREDCETRSHTIGMLLNLDEGTLTVYKTVYHNNTLCLGVMKDGLSGSYCWYTTVTSEHDAVGIRRGVAPRA